jgi:hypothetical protein
MANKREQGVIHEARCALLAWLGDSVDGGKALQQSLARLRIAFEDLDDTQSQRRTAKSCSACGKETTEVLRARGGSR